MEIPQNVKINVLAVLLSNGRDKGVRLDTFCETFQKIMKEQLHYQALGYRSLMEFFQAMPDVVRLKYRQREEAWEAYGIPKPNTFSPSERGHLSQFQKQTVTQSPVLQMQSGVKRPGFDVASVCSTEPDPDMVPVDVSKLVLVPDEKGLYTVCFTPDKRPKDWKDLKEMFSMAGPVVAINKTPKMIFVRYGSADVAQLAMKMFPFLNLKVATVNDGTKKQGIRKKEKKHKPHLEVVVTNLASGQTLTKVHLEELFLGYRLLSVNIIYNRDMSTERAYVKLPTEMEAQELIKNFSGFIFNGKPLDLFFRDDSMSLKKRAAFVAEASKEEAGTMPHSVPSGGPVSPALKGMPGLEQVCSQERPNLPDLPKFPLLSPLEERIKQSGVEIPTIFVTNFRNTFTEKDLGKWFADYDPISICFVPSAKGLQKAYIELPSVHMMKRAISEMCYKKIQGLNLKVDVPYFLPKLREEILGTNGRINPRGWKVRKHPQVMGDAGIMLELIEARSNVMTALMLPEQNLAPGEQVEVVVTCVVSDCLFMGQIVERDSLEKLKQISEKINKPCTNPPVAKCQGPCSAMYSKDKQFYRAWILSNISKSKDAEVYYVDYGNLETVECCNLRSNTEPWMWELPPLAVPFNLTEPILKLKERLHTHVTLEVIAVKDKMVVAKAVSLLPKWKMPLNTDTLLC